MKKTLLLAGIASLFAFNASAVELTPYAGVDYNLNFMHKANDFDGVFAGKMHSGSVVLGTKVTPYAAVEAFGELSKHENKRVFHTKYGAYGADVLGVLPLGCYGDWQLLGSAGVGRYVFQEKIKSIGKGYHFSQHEWGYRLGAGVQYNVTENWAVRGMYHHVQFHNFEVTSMNALSVGVRYSF